MGPIPIAPLSRTRVYIHIRISKDTSDAKGQATGPSIPDAGPKKTQEDALQEFTPSAADAPQLPPRF